MEKNVDRMANITKALAIMSRKDSAKKEILDIHKCIEDVHFMLSGIYRHEGILFELNLESESASDDPISTSRYGIRIIQPYHCTRKPQFTEVGLSITIEIVEYPPVYDRSICVIAVTEIVIWKYAGCD